MKKGILVIVMLITCMLALPLTGFGKAFSTMQSNSTSDTDKQQITNGPVAEYISDSNVVIGWSTQRPATMTIKYGTDRPHLNQTADASRSSDGHNNHVRLDDLKPDTQYFFQVMQNGEPVGAIGTFHTVALGATPIRSKAIIPQ